MYGGYFSSSEITDIDDKYIGSVIDLETLTKMTRQMKISMGGMMWLVSFFAVLIFAVLVYLLSKIIIEKNAQSISMALCYANLNRCRALRADQYSAERQDYRYHLESNAVTNDDGVSALLD